MFPDDCPQTIAGKSWWEKRTDNILHRGSLVFAFVPHFDQVPYAMEPIGRKDAEKHAEALIRVSPLKTNLPLKPAELPVAAMPLHAGEVWTAYRAKKRPCLVLGTSAPMVDQESIRGMPKASTAPTVLVAPYYGAKKTSTRAGFRPEFVDRIRHCEYRQFFWDWLPFPGGEESILRLDQIQPIGAHHDAYLLTDYQLSSVGVEFMDGMLSWLIWGLVRDDSLVALYRAEIEKTFPE